MTPTNLAKAAMPAPVKEMAAGVTDMKETFTDPLGQKKEKEEAERRGCGRRAAGRGRTAPGRARDAGHGGPGAGRTARARGAGRSSDLRRFSAPLRFVCCYFGPRESPRDRGRKRLLALAGVAALAAVIDAPPDARAAPRPHRRA